MNTLRNFNINKTVQVQKAKSNQVQNNAGGYVFKISDSSRLERFLILGVDSVKFYVNPSDLLTQDVDFLREMISTNLDKVLSITTDISVNGRAKSNDPALFVLALAMNESVEKIKISNALMSVARTATHLFTYINFLENLGGWGRAKRNSVAKWYYSKTPEQIAYQAVKYRQRNGFTHRDAFRLSHVKDIDNNVGNFILGKPHQSDIDIIVGFEKVQKASSIQEVLKCIKQYNLPWEAVSTEWHKNLELWKTLFYSNNLGQMALLRNVTRIAELGGFDDLKFASDYANRLASHERIEKSRLHPINYLNALNVYSKGKVIRKTFYYPEREKKWSNNSKISKALNDGFYKAFKNIEPANKRTLVALDVSGSMSQSAMGLDLSCAEVGATIAMSVVRTEPYAMVRGFSTNFIDLGITEDMSLSDIMKKTNSMNFGGTDCSLPMRWAETNNQKIDTFVVITDNETWFGKVHPFEALKSYRKSSGINAKLAVMAVSGTEFSIADPNDDGSMDFVGFDSSAPKILADFSAGRI